MSLLKTLQEEISVMGSSWETAESAQREFAVIITWKQLLKATQKYVITSVEMLPIL